MTLAVTTYLMHLKYTLLTRMIGDVTVILEILMDTRRKQGTAFQPPFVIVCPPSENQSSKAAHRVCAEGWSAKLPWFPWPELAFAGTLVCLCCMHNPTADVTSNKDLYISPI